MDKIGGFMMKTKRCIILLAVIMLFTHFVQNDAYATQSASGFGTYIDIHFHFTNQVIRGSTTAFDDDDFVTCADNLIKLMDQYGIHKVVVMPQPRLSG